jgi:hypothetical protein
MRPWKDTMKNHDGTIPLVLYGYFYMIEGPLEYTIKKELYG